MNQNKRAKKLTMSTMQKSMSQYDEKSRVDFEDGYVDVDKKFRPTKIALCIEELTDAIAISESQELKLDTLALIMLYLLKHFTSLDVPVDIKKQIVFLDLLFNGKYLSPILSAFEKDQIEEFNDKLKDAGLGLNMLREQLMKIESESKEETDNA